MTFHHESSIVQWLERRFWVFHLDNSSKLFKLVMLNPAPRHRIPQITLNRCSVYRKTYVVNNFNINTIRSQNRGWRPGRLIYVGAFFHPERDRKRATFLVLWLSLWYGIIFLFFKTNCAIILCHTVHMQQGFLRMSRRGSGLRISKIFWCFYPTTREWGIVEFVVEI